MSDEGRIFEPVKEHRGQYFVEYHPPRPSDLLARLDLVFPDDVAPASVADRIEQEFLHWIDRYPVPVMVSSFGPDEQLIPLGDVRSWDHLVGYIDSETGTPKMNWHNVPNDQIPVVDSESLAAIYSDVPSSTVGDVQKRARSQLRKTRVGILIIVAWVAGGSAAFALADFFGPRWLSIVFLAYAFWRAYDKAMRLLGKHRKSPAELAEEAERLRMRHHHYHCERNPEGFERLRNENYERWERQSIKEESEQIAQSS